MSLEDITNTVKETLPVFGVGIASGTGIAAFTCSSIAEYMTPLTFGLTMATVGVAVGKLGRSRYGPSIFNLDMERLRNDGAALILGVGISVLTYGYIVRDTCPNFFI